MNSKNISDILKVRCKDMFLGVFPRDRLPLTLPPRRPLLLICNTDPHSRPGEHWIALYVSSTTGEYFDSFGQSPLLIFKRFLDKFCPKWIMIDKKLQSILSSFCAHYCIFYSLFKYLGYDMKCIMDC